MKTAYSYTRFSSVKQSKGDSQRRQTEGAEKWCQQEGYTLSATTYKDLGVSGFTGDNRTKGALGAFLTAVEDEQIVRGSVLVVENLDRISRQHILEAFPIVCQILQAGVNIATLLPSPRLLTAKSDNMDIMFSLIEMMRGNSESQIKSDRGKANWQQKRKDASQGKIISVLSPSWLSKSGEDWKKIDDKVAIVKRVFTMALTYGGYAIAQQLNAENVPCLGRTKFWRRRAITFLLTNRRILGEYQPMTGGRKIGGAIPNYYPEIITPDLFHRVGAKIKQRRQKGKGRQGDSVACLFSGLWYSSIDKTSLHIRGRKHKGKRYDYIKSTAKINGFPNADLSCFPYGIFETAVLKILTTIKLQDEPAPVDEGDELRGQLVDCQERIKTTQERISTAPDYATLLDVLMGLETRENELRARIETTTAKQPTSEVLKTLQEHLRDGADRRVVKSKIADMVERMELTSIGNCTAEIRFKSGAGLSLIIDRKGALVNAKVHLPAKVFDELKSELQTPISPIK
jgi:DNA invertase Pin-like site-specific DNA recombinase